MVQGLKLFFFPEVGLSPATKEKWLRESSWQLQTALDFLSPWGPKVLARVRYDPQQGVKTPVTNRRMADQVIL